MFTILLLSFFECTITLISCMPANITQHTFVNMIPAKNACLLETTQQIGTLDRLLY